MAEQLNDKEAGMGILVPVKNLEKTATANSTYYAIKLEAEDGGDECWGLFTANEIYGKVPFTCGDWIEDMKSGRLYKFGRPSSKVQSFLLKIERPVLDSDDYETVVIVMNNNSILKATKRATKNPEDIPSQGWLADLMD